MKVFKFKRVVIASALILGGTVSLNIFAQSVTQIVGGVTYTISLSSSTSYNSISSTLQTSSIWGNASLAQTLATNIGLTSVLGSPNIGGAGPLFAYGSSGSSVSFFYKNSNGVYDQTISPGMSMYWALVSGGGTSPTDLSISDTQASIQNTASALQSTYALQNSVVANSLNYDCQVFDKNDVCVSGGARNTAVNAGGLNNFSALLVAAYRAMPEVRLGAYLDQNLSVNNGSSPVKLGVGSPLFGLFGVWNQNPDGTETEVRVSAAYGQKNATITRGIIGTSEAGVGSSSLNNTGVQAIAKYGFALDQDLIVSPYVGIRYSQGNMGGYTEASSATVTTPLTYAALNTNATTFMAGVHGKYKLTPEAVVQASAGLETDMGVNNGTLTATGLTGLTPINFNPNPVKTRPVAMLGAYYDIEKNHRVGVTGIYRQEPFQAVGNSTVMATYTVGL